jgi:hypothetical protein
MTPHGQGQFARCKDESFYWQTLRFSRRARSSPFVTLQRKQNRNYNLLLAWPSSALEELCPSEPLSTREPSPCARA